MKQDQESQILQFIKNNPDIWEKADNRVLR
jgi:hypothetical protein